MNWYVAVLKNYAGFSGRARRKEYWMFVLFNILFAFIALILDNILGIAIREIGYGPIYGLYSLAVFIPGLAVAVRRLHDIGKSGWFLLIALIPIIGAIWLLVLMATDSDPEQNEYGENPKDAQSTGLISDNVSGDMVLMLVVIWMFFSRLFFAVLPFLFENFYEKNWFQYVNAFLGLIWAIVPIALATTVKDKSKQLVLFVLGGIYLAYGLFEVIKPFMGHRW